MHGANHSLPGKRKLKMSNQTFPHFAKDITTSRATLCDEQDAQGIVMVFAPGEEFISEHDCYGASEQSYGTRVAIDSVRSQWSA
jgi:hypothetical protein